MRRNQKKKKEKITKENKQTNSEIECTQVRGGFLGLGAGEYVQKPHKKNWGAKIEPAGCRQKLYFSGLCNQVLINKTDLICFDFKKNKIEKFCSRQIDDKFRQSTGKVPINHSQFLAFCFCFLFFGVLLLNDLL